MVYTGEVVSGNGGHYNQSALQQDGVYSTEYELVGPHSSCNNTVLEFDNPLYSDRGPVTFTENELVSLTYALLTMCVYMYTPWEFYTITHVFSSTHCKLSFSCLFMCFAD